ncbi:MAG: ATP-binding protein, partial [Bdellovibrionia bacterium]
LQRLNRVKDKTRSTYRYLMARNPLRPRLQLIAGVLLMLVGLGFERLLWPWVGSHNLIVLIPWVILAAWFVGGSLAGLTALGVGLLGWFIIFRPLVATEVRPAHMEWAAVVAYLLTGLAFSLLGSQWLVGLTVRADQLERLEYAVLAAKVGIWEWDIVHDTIQWDDQMLHLYGLTREQFGGNYRAWAQGLHPEDVERSNQAIQGALLGKAAFDLNFRVVWPDGTIRHLHASAFVRRDARGKPIVMYGLNRDITDEVLTLSKLHEVNAFFQAAMDQSPVGIVIVDAPSGLIRFANDAALAIRGGTRNQLVEGVALGEYQAWQTVSLDGIPLPNEQTPLARSFLTGEKMSQEVGMINARGELRVLLTNTAPIRRQDGTIGAGIAVFFDHTERHQLLEQIQAARESAERALGAKSRFLDIAAHELRTPVTAFSLLLQITQKRLAEGCPVSADVLVRLRAQVDRLSRLVVDLLEVSRLDRGMVILKKESRDLGQILGECLSSFELQYPDRKFMFRGNHRSIVCKVDPVRIYEVISNLIDNALKYSPASSPIEIELAVPSSHTVRVSIGDQGPGIPAERWQALFQPFERGSSAGESAHAGLGLGLYICKKIIELHEGIIGLESTVGQGSTFFFELPVEAVIPGAVSQ